MLPLRRSLSPLSARLGAPAWRYTDISGCVLLSSLYKTDYLYQASDRTNAVTANGQVVGSIQDESGSGNHLYQATSGYKAIWTTNVINGLGAVRFDAADDFYNVTNQIDMQTATLFIAAIKRDTDGNFAGLASVYKPANGTYSGGLIGDYAGGNQNFYFFSAGNEIFLAGTRSGSYRNVPIIYTYRANTTSAQLRINGTQVANDSSSTLSGGTSYLEKIGVWSGVYKSKDILKVVCYNQRLSDGDMTTVEAAINTELGGLY